MNTNQQENNTMTTTEQHTEPAAWIGCLACYNNGTLRGKWITARQAADEFNSDEPITYAGQAEPATYPSGTTYARCVACGGDEFHVFDMMNLGTIRPSVMSFYRDAEQLADLDDAGDLERILVLTGWLGTTSLDALIDYDAENYCGQWDTFQEWADDYIENSGLLVDAPEPLANYFDYDKYARDLEMDYYYDQATGHTWRSV
jgi:antirestriction protein